MLGKDRSRARTRLLRWFASIIFLIPALVLGSALVFLLAGGAHASLLVWGSLFLGGALIVGFLGPLKDPHLAKLIVPRDSQSMRGSRDTRSVPFVESPELMIFLAVLAELTRTDWEQVREMFGRTFLTLWWRERRNRGALMRLSRLTFSQKEVQDIACAKDFVFDLIFPELRASLEGVQMPDNQSENRVFATADLSLAEQTLNSCIAIVAREKLSDSDFRLLCSPFLNHL
jgi:hypothetical protein